jgi:hypothetical protein
MRRGQDMSNPNFEDEQSSEVELEVGGGLQDPGDQRSYKVARLRGEFQWNGLSASGDVDGPAGLAPLVLLMAAMVIGGLIWAASSWQAGAAVMVGSIISYLLYAFLTRKKRESE